jgi:thiamine monophosphate synthase
MRGDRELRGPKLIAEVAGAVFLPAIAISGITRQNVGR